MLNLLVKRVRAFVTEEDGPTSTEYAILLALIIVAVVVTIRSTGLSLRGIFSGPWDDSNPQGATSGTAGGFSRR
jgi:Flp pilus assembly pilin Flp